MKKLKIAFDIDGVLAKFNDSWAKMMKEDFDKEPNLPLIWDLEKTWDLSLKQVIESFQKFTSEARWIDIEVDLGWFNILKDLSKKDYEIDLVTFRGTHTSDPQEMRDDIQAQTIAWAEKKGIKPFVNNIYFKSQKTKFIIDGGYDILIDDCPHIYFYDESHDAVTRDAHEFFRDRVLIIAEREWNDNCGIPSIFRMTPETFKEGLKWLFLNKDGNG